MAKRRLLAALLWLAALPPAGRARAQGDGAYGRLDADLALSAALGAGAAFGDRNGADATLALGLELRARLVETAGLFLAAEWRPEGSSRVVVGVDLRPVFLARFFLGAETGQEWIDLLVDSIGLDLGAALGPLDAGVGVGTAVGLGLDVPLHVPGPGDPLVFLHLSGRWVSGLPSDRLGPVGGTDDVVVLGLLGVRGLVDVGLAGWEPARYDVRAPEE